MPLQKVDIADPPTVVRQQTVELLELALEMAKAGELREVIIGGVLDDGDSWYGFTDALAPRERIALMEYVKAQWMREWLDGEG